jgi:hypothetical protein
VSRRAGNPDILTGRPVVAKDEPLISVCRLDDLVRVDAHDEVAMGNAALPALVAAAAAP